MRRSLINFVRLDLFKCKKEPIVGEELPTSLATNFDVVNEFQEQLWRNEQSVYLPMRKYMEYEKASSLYTQVEFIQKLAHSMKTERPYILINPREDVISNKELDELNAAMTLTIQLVKICQLPWSKIDYGKPPDEPKLDLLSFPIDSKGSISLLNIARKILIPVNHENSTITPPSPENSTSGETDNSKK